MNIIFERGFLCMWDIRSCHDVIGLYYMGHIFSIVASIQRHSVGVLRLNMCLNINVCITVYVFCFCPAKKRKRNRTAPNFPHIICKLYISLNIMYVIPVGWLMDGWTDGGTNGRTNGWVAGWREVLMTVCMDRWIDVSMVR